ncbi:hypothetical protein ACTZWT_02435 [Rhodopseudomonas sp. NSM]|uniref:hypothetical protein n=1 Tax=Rhodopseudomonas sp. NSM TaxID=3457630 RepID=UPI0040356340
MKPVVVALQAVWVMLASRTLALSVLAAVTAAAVLAFGFGAQAELIILLLALGALTALAETAIRARQQ